MALKETFKHLRDLLSHITADLEKADGGNKAASQRVRTGTVKLEKVAKLYRKESIANEKKTKGHPKPSKAKSAAKAKAPAKGHASAKSKAPVKAAAKAPAKSVVKAKPKAKATSFRARQSSVKRASAKLPTKKFRSAR
jgi:hypothetical protein